MRSTIDVSYAVSDFRESKQPVSPLSQRFNLFEKHPQPLLKHEVPLASQAYYRKRPRTSNLISSHKIQNAYIASVMPSPSIYKSERDIGERVINVARKSYKPNNKVLGTTNLKSNMVAGTDTP